MSKSTVTKMEKKSLDSLPNETITFEKGKVEVAKVGDTTIGRGYFEPGWTWEKSIKPMIKVKLDDGTEEEFSDGDIAYVPPGHNSWVVGNKPLVILDFSGFKGNK